MLEKALEEFGLSEKEAKVYLAALELGTASVQDIARKANVNRATTYIQLDSLVKRGLVSNVLSDKKAIYMAEKPQRFMEILGEQRSSIEKAEKKISGLMPDFETIYNALATTTRPRVRFLVGEPGLTFWRRDVVKIKPAIMYGIYCYNIIGPEEKLKKFIKNVGLWKVLYIYKENFPNILVPYRNAIGKFLQKPEFKLDINLYANKVFINKPVALWQRKDLREKDKENVAILIEDKTFYESFVAVFELLWQSAQDLL